MSLRGYANATLSPFQDLPRHIFEVCTSPATVKPEQAMGLQSLDICDFRNIKSAALVLSPGLNFVSGENAAGKTSLLEAIYCLGRVRSFRTPVAVQPIRDGQAAFRLVGRVATNSGRQLTIGIERQRKGLIVHLDGQPIRRLSDLAGSFPVQVLSGDTQTILNGGPRYRRQTLDWALFHVEQSYRDVWQRYTRALRQRNAALRAGSPAGQVTTWDAEILEAAGRMHTVRHRYFEMLEPCLQSEIKQLLPDKQLVLRYQPGWATHGSLQEALSSALEKDRQQGFTQYGPHRADFSIQIDGRGVVAHCSRGQQKLVVVSFMLAQVQLQQQQSVPMGAFLLDDLTSELDVRHQRRVLSALCDLHVQVVVSMIEPADVDAGAWPAVKKFHVEHGVIQEVV